MLWCGSDLELFQAELVTYEVENLFLGPVQISPCSLLTKSYKGLSMLETGMVGPGSDQPVI